MVLAGLVRGVRDGKRIWWSFLARIWESTYCICLELVLGFFFRSLINMITSDTSKSWVGSGFDRCLGVLSI